MVPANHFPFQPANAVAFTDCQITVIMTGLSSSAFQLLDINPSTHPSPLRVIPSYPG